MGRTITVVSGLTDRPKRILSSASTWGELKNDLVSTAGFQASALNSMDGIVRNDNGTIQKLSRSEDTIPSGDFRVLLQPQEIKLGVSAEELTQELEDAIAQLSAPDFGK